MWRSLSLLAVLQVSCRTPLPSPPGEPVTKPTPDAGLPGDDTPTIEPDTGSPLNPTGVEAAPQELTNPR